MPTAHQRSWPIKPRKLVYDERRSLDVSLEVRLLGFRSAAGRVANKRMSCAQILTEIVDDTNGNCDGFL